MRLLHLVRQVDTIAFDSRRAFATYESLRGLKRRRVRAAAEIMPVVVKISVPALVAYIGIAVNFARRMAGGTIL